MQNQLKTIAYACLLLCFAFIGCKQVDPLPTADFLYKEQANGTIDFTNTSTNATTYSWDFGDGEMSISQHPQKTYKKNGTYTVTLVAKSDAGQNNITRAVKVNTAPTTGQFMFWTTCQRAKDILVYVEGKYQNKITAYYPVSTTTAPACASQYNVTVTLAEGTYNYTAQTDELFPVKWSGQISVINGQCRTIKLTCN